MKGEVVKVLLQLGEVKKGVVGYQFSLDFDQIKLELVDLNFLNFMVKVDEYFGDFRDKGMLIISWNDLEGLGLDVVFFEMIFVVKLVGFLVNWMMINNVMILVLVYDDGMIDMKVVLVFVDEKELLELD